MIILLFLNDSNIINRWVIFDLEWQDGGRKVSKVCFITYSPDCNPVNEEKFAIAAQKEAIKSKVNECNRDFQINRWEDLKEDDFVKVFS